jgi:hypothetical protein
MPVQRLLKLTKASASAGWKAFRPAINDKYTDHLASFREGGDSWG